jgi:hypothetical protein
MRTRVDLPAPFRLTLSPQMNAKKRKCSECVIWQGGKKAKFAFIGVHSGTDHDLRLFAVWF